VTERVSVPADLTQLDPVRRWVLNALTEGDVPDAVAGDIELAVTEALSNVVRHTFAGRQGTIDVELDVDADAGRVRVVLTDDGPPWDGTRRAPAADGGGGYGLDLMDDLMDVVEHLPLAPTGNRLVLEKRLPA
jgi:anti-sigma regulatory factor (Ser/Thr protein kinase)